MICDVCQKNAATNHYTEIASDGSKSEKHLCDECVKNAQGVELLNKIAGGIDLAKKIEVATKELLDERKCEECGITLREILENGKLGCPNDYDTFAKELNAIMLKMHGSNIHTGRLPKIVSKQKQLRDLNKQMNAAVKTEDYESAAELRDKIVDLEAEVQV